MRKQTTVILERRDANGELANGGMHRQKAYRRITAMLDGHDFKNARLYHFVLMDREVSGPDDPDRFLSVVKALCRELRAQRIRYRWRAALELDEEKGLHLHVFMLLENDRANPDGLITSNRNTTAPPRFKPDGTPYEPARIRQPDGTLGKPVRTLGDIMEDRMLGFHIAPPKADIHRTKHGKRLNYATIASDEKRADCLVWMSYLVKARSKPDHVRGIYFSSRDSRHQPREAA